MDDGKQIFKNSRPNQAYERWMSYETDKERYKKVTGAIQTYPHTEEVVEVTRLLGGVLPDISKTERALSFNFNTKRYLSGSLNLDTNGLVRFFSPYDRSSPATGEYVGAEFETTAVVFDIYDKRSTSESIEPSGYLMMFRLGFAGEEVTASKIGIGENAQYGAIIEKGSIRPIRIQTDVKEEETQSELRRRDSMTGEETVDARAVSTRVSPAKCYELSKNDDAYIEVLDEVDRFIEQCGPEKSE